MCPIDGDGAISLRSLIAGRGSGRAEVDHVAERQPALGDGVAAPQGRVLRTVRVLALGSRRGPASEAGLLYEETSAPVRLTDLAPAWDPLLAEGDRV